MKNVIISDRSLKPKEYFEQLIQAFTDFKKEQIEEGAEMLHWNMERFAEFTIEQIKTSNIDKLKDCFEFQEQRIKYINAELENALHVSYCESLLLAEVRTDMNNVLKLMGPQLRRVYKEYEVYYENLGKANK